MQFPGVKWCLSGCPLHGHVNVLLSYRTLNKNEVAITSSLKTEVSLPENGNHALSHTDRETARNASHQERRGQEKARVTENGLIILHCW